MEDKQIEFLAGIFGQPVEDFKILLVEKVEGQDPKPLDTAAAQAKLAAFLKAEHDRHHEQGVRKGTRERMTQFEQNIRAKHGAEFKQEGEALIDAIVAKREADLAKLKADLEELKTSGKAPKEMDGEQAKVFIVNHPFFKEKTDEFNAAIQAKEAEFEKFKNETLGREAKNVVKIHAKDYLNNVFKPQLPEDPTIAQTLLNAFMDSLLGSANYKIDENGKPGALDQHGDPVVHPDTRRILEFEQWVAYNAAKWFRPQPADKNKGAGGAGGKEAGGGMPDWSKMTVEEINKTVLQETDPARNRELLKSATEHLRARN